MPDYIKLGDMWAKARMQHPSVEGDQAANNLSFLDSLEVFRLHSVAEAFDASAAVRENKRAIANLLRGLANDLEAQP